MLIKPQEEFDEKWDDATLFLVVEGMLPICGLRSMTVSFRVGEDEEEASEGWDPGNKASFMKDSEYWFLDILDTSPRSEVVFWLKSLREEFWEVCITFFFISSSFW